MSTDYLPNPKPLSALLVVEGEKTEIEFFNLFGERIGLNLTLHAVKCNVYTLFKWMKEECDGTDLTRDDFVLDVPKLIAQHETDESVRTMLQQHYDALYLVYDCDLQDSRVSDKDNPRPIESRARANLDELDQMVNLLDDEYSMTVGKLYLNYPMFEACWDADSFSDPAFSLRMFSLDELPCDGYKHCVTGRLLHHAWQSGTDWKREDFFDLIKMNICKAGHLLGGGNMGGSFDEIERFLSQDAILKAQRRSVEESGALAVLNTSVFLPIEQFGAKYPAFYSQVMEKREFPTLGFVGKCDDSPMLCDFVVFMERPHPKVGLLVNELKGIIRLFPKVDVIVFANDFCHSIPDYHNLFPIYNMSNPNAKEALLLRLRTEQNTNWCCRTALLNGGMRICSDVLEHVKNCIAFIR